MTRGKTGKARAHKKHNSGGATDAEVEHVNQVGNALYPSWLRKLPGLSCRQDGACQVVEPRSSGPSNTPTNSEDPDQTRYAGAYKAFVDMNAREAKSPEIRDSDANRYYSKFAEDMSGTGTAATLPVRRLEGQTVVIRSRTRPVFVNARGTTCVRSFVSDTAGGGRKMVYVPVSNKAHSKKK